MKKINTNFKIIALLFLAISTSFFAQTNRVGVQTEFPSERMDVNGTLRVRTLPVNGGNSNTTIPGGAYSAANVIYNPVSIAVTNDQGVVGSLAAGTDTSDASNAMFVIRRYLVEDNPTFDLGMTVAKWEPILSNVMYEIYTTDSNFNPTGPPADYSTFNNPFKKFNQGGNLQFGWRIAGGATNWRIIGDINTVKERSTVDVLFINKKYIAAEARTN